MKAKERRYTQRYVDALNAKIKDLESRNEWQSNRVTSAVAEERRLTALVDARWDEMQRLRDLIFAIATKGSPRNVVEREIQKLGGTIEPVTEWHDLGTSTREVKL